MVGDLDADWLRMYWRHFPIEESTSMSHMVIMHGVSMKPSDSGSRRTGVYIDEILKKVLAASAGER